MGLYRKSHIGAKINKIKPKRLIIFRLWFLVLCIIFTILCVLIYFLVFWEKIQLKDIVLSEYEKTNPQEIENVIFDAININFLKIGNIKVESRSIFLVNKQKIENAILEKYPAIESVNIKRSFPTALNVVIKERQPLGAFCQGHIVEECYLVDAGGVIFERISHSNLLDENGNCCAVSIVRQMGEDKLFKLGQNAISNEVAKQVDRILAYINENIEIKIKELSLVGSERINMTTIQNWKIFIDRGESQEMQKQLKKLELLLQSELTEEQILTLKYIDLRPSGRAIVCDNANCGK